MSKCCKSTIPCRGQVYDACLASILANLVLSIGTRSTNSTMNKWFNSPQLSSYYNNKSILELLLPVHKVSLDFQVYCNILQSWISFTKSSFGFVTSTWFLFNTSTFECLDPVLWMTLQQKSYNVLIHLLFLL